MILAIDVISNFSGIALLSDDSKQKEILWESKQNQAKELLPKIKELLLKNKSSFSALKKIAVITGPGSFTGIRIGISVANALGFALKIPVVGTDTLMAMAVMNIKTKKGKTRKVVPILEANREQLYYARYEINSNNVKITTGPQVVKITELSKLIGKSDYLVGQASEYNQDVIKNILIENECQFIINKNQNHRALAAARLAFKNHSKEPSLTQPFYVKKANITQSLINKRAKSGNRK